VKTPEEIAQSIITACADCDTCRFLMDSNCWLKKQSPKALEGLKGKVAYFAGCTGRYLFPEVPKAVMEVLQRNQIEVDYPDQRCCGMPSMLEGDQKLTLQFVRENLEFLTAAIDKGYDILCSCPTCGFFFKFILQAGAYYSKAYQDAVGADKDHIKVPRIRLKWSLRIGEGMPLGGR